MVRDIRRIVVFGGGTMGGGIAALCARRNLELHGSVQLPDGLAILVVEETPELQSKACEKIFERFNKWEALGKVDAEGMSELHLSVSFTSSLSDVFAFEPDLVVEAIIEEKEAKCALFAELDRRLASHVNFASNTSTIPIAELARATDRQHRVIGAHFFNPATTMPLVEMIPSEATSLGTFEDVANFAHSVLGKTVIRVKDQPGFLVNRLLLPYLSEAVLVLQEFRGFTVQELDSVALAGGWPMGPFKLLDTVGIDVAYNACRAVAERVEGVVVPELFSRMVKDGSLGDKTGSGFYAALPGERPLDEVLDKRFPDRLDIGSLGQVYAQRILPRMLREAVISLENDVASIEDIETGAQLGIGCPEGGPLHMIDNIGAKRLADILRAQKRNGARFSVPEFLAEKAARNGTFFSSWGD